MSQEPREPSAKSGRRRVLKRLLIGLGASAIIQPNGGVFGLAFGQEKKEGEEEGGKKKKKGKKKDGEEPKKE
jgi:hypothetical protein